jgi:hypothetical protein
MAEANRDFDIINLIIPPGPGPIPDELLNILFDREIAGTIVEKGKRFYPEPEKMSKTGFRITPGTA